MFNVTDYRFGHDEALVLRGGEAHKRAAAIYRELSALARDGKELPALDPAEVLERAKDPASPLHEFIEWEDAKAADRWRLQQARTLLQIEIKIIDVNAAEGLAPVEHWTRAFIRSQATEENAPHYHPIEIVLSRPDLRADASERFEAELTALYMRKVRFEGLIPTEAKRVLRRMIRKTDTLTPVAK